MALARSLLLRAGATFLAGRHDVEEAGQLEGVSGWRDVRPGVTPPEWRRDVCRSAERCLQENAPPIRPRFR